MQVANSVSNSLSACAESLQCSTEDKQIAVKLDEEDELASFRDLFYLPTLGENNDKDSVENNPQCIYFCSNSLGLQPKSTEAKIKQHLETWKEMAVEGHFAGPEPWASIEDVPISHICKLVGACPSEVVLMNTLTVNLHLFLLAFYRPSSQRYKILIEQTAFPSDDYAVQSQVMLHGLDPQDSIIRVSADSSTCHSEKKLLDTVFDNRDTLCLVLLPGVHYLSGQVFPMEKLSKLCQELGIYIGFDLAHVVGNIPLSLHDWGVDFACWCSYKYLCGGPGAIGGAFLHERYSRKSIEELPRLVGWWANKRETRFQMKSSLDCAPGIYGFQLSNPSVFSIACVVSALEIFDKTSMRQIREKSVMLTGYLEFLILTKLEDYVTVITPKEAEKRGCQLSLRLKRHNLKQVHSSLRSKKVICDTREPDILRVSPFPLYNTFQEVFDFVNILSDILISNKF
eukprot:jgi/Galph1/1146/GphlegSOOS_G5833.1